MNSHMYIKSHLQKKSHVHEQSHVHKKSHVHEKFAAYILKTDFNKIMRKYVGWKSLAQGRKNRKGPVKSLPDWVFHSESKFLTSWETPSF